MKSWIIAAILRLVREAAGEMSLDDRMAAVYRAVRKKYGSSLDNYDTYPVAVFDDSVIVRKGDQTWRVSYAFDDEGEVEFGADAVEVKQVWQPVQEQAIRAAAAAMRESIVSPRTGAALETVVRIPAYVLGPVRESDDAEPTGESWDVIVIQEGLSKNRNRYGRKCLAEAVNAGLYENAQMFADHSDRQRSVRETIGFLRGTGAVLLTNGPKESDGARLAVSGRAYVIDESFSKPLLKAYRLGNPDLFGLSHDVRAESAAVMLTDGPAYEVGTIRKCESVDWVVNPAAGGRVVRLVAADVPNPQLEEDGRMLKHLIEQLTRAGVTVPEGADEQAVIALFAKAVREGKIAGEPTPPASTDPRVTEQLTSQQAQITALQEQVRVGAQNAATLMLDRNLAECALPDVIKNRLRTRFTADIAAGRLPTEDAIVAAVREQVEDWGALAEARVVLPHAGIPRVGIVQDRADKIRERFAAFFDVTKPLQSFRELYIDITGDRQVTGKLTEEVRRNLEANRLSESLTTASFDQIFGDSIRRAMLKDYAAAGLAQWRNTIAEVVPLSDFRTVRRIRFGGYGNLSIVAQGAAYPALTSPTDEEATYAPAKRGGTEQLTWEMIKNDDVGAIRRMPNRLARAAVQTLHEFVWDLLGNNSNVYDAVALAAAGHNNIVTTAISGANISSLRLKLKQQTDMSNGKRLSLVARYLIVPSELEETAFQLTTSDRVLGSANNDPNFVKKLNLETIVVEYWTDTNNYWVTASTDQTPMIEVGFLDGQEEPDLLLSDQLTVGSMFSNDQLTYKLRHVYGAAVNDFRGFAGGIVP